MVPPRHSPPVRLLLVLGGLIAVAGLGAGLAGVAGGGRTQARGPAAATPSGAAPASPSPVPERSPVGGSPATSTVTVVIDPGHNGQNWAHTTEIGRTVKVPTGEKPCDTEGTAAASGYSEAAYNLDLASVVASVLSDRGVHVVLTRTTNDGWGPCIDQRVAVANDVRADATISIHADGGPASGRGFFVLYAAPAPGSPDSRDPLAVAGRRLALATRDAYGQGTGLPYSTYAGREGLLTVPWPTLYHVPEVLMETGNMRNATDAALLQDPAFRQRAARALAAGLSAYLSGR